MKKIFAVVGVLAFALVFVMLFLVQEPSKNEQTSLNGPNPFIFHYWDSKCNFDCILKNGEICGWYDQVCCSSAKNCKKQYKWFAKKKIEVGEKCSTPMKLNCY